jgi:hypothetical protein
VNSLGPIEEGTAEKIVVKITDEERARLQRVEARPALAEILNLHDFEVRTRFWPCFCSFIVVQGNRQTYDA